MKDERFAEYLSGLIRESDPPPPAPRDAMWAHIEAARRGRRPGNPSSPRPTPESPPRLPTQVGHGKGAVGAARHLRPGHRVVRQARWAVPLAAALLIGISIGRVTRPVEPGPQEQSTARAPGGPASSADLAYRLVATEHLDAAEALLSALPHDARRGDVDAVSSWAEDLLLTTRLLLDSPAADDPHMATLFQDLELVLAQIATISAAEAEGEVELIEEGIRQNNVLLRVRAATTRRTRPGLEGDL